MLGHPQASREEIVVRRLLGKRWCILAYDRHGWFVKYHSMRLIVAVLLVRNEEALVHEDDVGSYGLDKVD